MTSTRILNSGRSRRIEFLAYQVRRYYRTRMRRLINPEWESADQVDTGSDSTGLSHGALLFLIAKLGNLPAPSKRVTEDCWDLPLQISGRKATARDPRTLVPMSGLSGTLLVRGRFRRFQAVAQYVTAFR